MTISRNDVAFSVHCEPEDLQIEGNASAIDAETDEEVVFWIKTSLDCGNEWAWCAVFVTCEAIVDGELRSAHASLGACSYLNEEEFKTPGGYYEDLCDEAFQELLEDLRN